jgi:hypothetical protein
MESGSEEGDDQVKEQRKQQISEVSGTWDLLSI